MKRTTLLASFLLVPSLALAQVAPTGGAVIYASNYGVTANTGADETVAMQAALTACNGDVLQLPAGQIDISTTLVSSAPCDVVGTGAADGFGGGTSGTIINQTSASGGGFAFTTLDGDAIRDLAIVMPNNGSGTGIAIQSGATNNLNRGSRVYNVRIDGGATGVSCFHCGNYAIRDNFIRDFGETGIYLGTDANQPDIGDGIVSGNTVWDFNVTTGSAGLRLDPQAGVEVTGNKFLGATFGIWLTISAGPTGTLNIAQNSLEQQSVAHIYVQQTVSGATYADITITGNEMENYGISSFQSGIAITNNATQYLSDVAITGNTIRDCQEMYGMIDVQDVTGATITGNVMDACGSGAPGITLGANALDVVQTGNVEH